MGKNMHKISTYRQHLSYEKLIQMLTLLELILSVIFFITGHLINNAYVRGVGVGLVISWVTSGLAYLIVRRAKATASSPAPKGGISEGASR